MKLVEMILNEMNNVSKNQKNFFILLMQTIVSMYGRVNFRSLSRYSDTPEKTFRRWFKKPFDFSIFNARAIDKVITPETEIIAAFDPSFLSKAGESTWGVGFFWNSCISKAEKGLELSLCALVDVGKNIAYALEAQQTPPTDEIKGDCEDATRIDFYLSFVEKLRLLLLKYTKYFVADGYFAKKKFVDGIILFGFVFIGKLRIDANLRMLFEGEQKKGPGRPKKFAGKCNVKALEGFTFVADIDDENKLYSGIFYHASLERAIKVVAVTTQHKNKIGTALLFSTDLTLDAVTIYRYYKARYQIEFIFRDAKQFTGLGDSQSRNKESLHYHFNASFTALNAIRIQELLEWPSRPNNTPFSMASHKARNHNESMIETIFSKLGFDLSLIKSSPIYQEVLNYGTISFRGS
jgi:hypothetical protein